MRNTVTAEGQRNAASRIAIALGVAAALVSPNPPAMAENLPAAVDDAVKVRPIVAGATLPTQQVVDPDGKSTPLAVALGAGKHVLIVYRGGWCPICTRHFAAVGQTKKELEAAGWQFAALSPDTPAAISAWRDEHGDDGIVRFSDSDVDAIRALGLAFVVDAKTRERYAGYGIDLEAASGQSHFTLPVPAVLLVVDGEVRAIHADANYRRRLRPEVLRAMVQAIEAHTLD